jgi:hypothetical protein
MSSFSLSGDLPPSIANAVKAATPADDGIDLSKDGSHLIAKSGDVSFFASFANGKVTEFFCTDKSEARIPSFILRDQGKDAEVCYCCCTDDAGNTTCHKWPCKWM